MDNNIDQWPSKSIQRSIDEPSSMKRRSDNEVIDSESEVPVRLASIALFAKNLFHDIIVRQLRGLYQLVKTATQVFNSDSS